MVSCFNVPRMEESDSVKDPGSLLSPFPGHPIRGLPGMLAVLFLGTGRYYCKNLLTTELSTQLLVGSG